MRDHCKACDVIRTDLEGLFDDELCMECWQIANYAAHEDFNPGGKDETSQI